MWSQEWVWTPHERHPEVGEPGLPAENFKPGAYGFVRDSDQKVNRSEEVSAPASSPLDPR